MKKALSIVLAVFIVLTSTVCSFAADTIKYVHIGDSSSNGYGFSDFPIKDNPFGYRANLENTFPAILAKFFERQAKKSIVFENIACSGFRPEELCYMLCSESEYTYIPDAQAGFIDQMLGTKGGIFSFKEKYGNDYKQQIEDADIITLQLGMNNFSSAMLMSILNNYSVLDSLLERNGVKDQWNERKAEIIANIKAAIGIDLASEAYSKYVTAVDILIYSYWNFMQSFDLGIKKIKELNPHADIYVIGIADTNINIVFDEEDMILPYGILTAIFRAIANSYMKLHSFCGKNYSFVDLTGNVFNTIADEYYAPICKWDEETLWNAKNKLQIFGLSDEEITEDMLARFKSAFENAFILKRQSADNLETEYESFRSFYRDESLKDYDCESLFSMAKRMHTIAYLGTNSYGMHLSIKGHKDEARAIIKAMR